MYSHMFNTEFVIKPITYTWTDLNAFTFPFELQIIFHTVQIFLSILSLFYFNNFCLCFPPSSVFVCFFLSLTGRSVSCHLLIVVWLRIIYIDQPRTPCWDTRSLKIWQTRDKFASCSKITWIERGRRERKVRRNRTGNGSVVA